MDFLQFLNDYDNEDMSSVLSIVESNKKQKEKILSEVFNTEFNSKREALFILDNYFVDDELAPEGIDTEYVNEHISELRDDINNMNEGDIRIIIHNHEGPGKGKSVEGFEETNTPKKKRGRPRNSEVPKNTGVIYDETDPENLPKAGDEVQEVGDERIFDDIISDVDKTEEKTISDDVKPEKVKWSDIVKKVESNEKQAKDSLVEELAKLSLDDDELQQATEMAESGDIAEDNSKISKGAGIISKLKS